MGEAGISEVELSFTSEGGIGKSFVQTLKGEGSFCFHASLANLFNKYFKKFVFMKKN